MLAHGMLCALSKGYIDAVIASNPVAFWPLLSDTLDVVGINNLTGSANFSAVPLINGYEKAYTTAGIQTCARIMRLLRSMRFL